MFPFTRVPFWVHIVDPQPTAKEVLHRPDHSKFGWTQFARLVGDPMGGWSMFGGMAVGVGLKGNQQETRSHFGVSPKQKTFQY